MDPDLVKLVLDSGKWRISILPSVHACSGLEFKAYLLRVHVVKRVLWMCGDTEGSCELYARQVVLISSLGGVWRGGV